jgi:glutamyl-tRNA synthetase
MFITRFAPSPTGLLHVGNARTALIAWLLARQAGGTFILRIDDTDKSRSEERFVEAVKEDLSWLGITWDETFRQSDRIARYQEAKEQLIAAGRLYPCYESQEELEIKKKNQLKLGLPPLYDRAALKLTSQEKEELERSGLKPHWRFLLEPGDIIWEDLIRGSMQFKAEKLTDPILFKEDGSMTYTLASVVDDLDYKITHIIRGEDHLTNSATHLQIFKALGARLLPKLGHLSLMVSQKGEISKRLGGFDIKGLRDSGIEAMTINSFLAKIGSSDPVEPFLSLQDLMGTFAIEKASKAPINYDLDELERLNNKLIQLLPYDLVQEKTGLQFKEDFWTAIHGNISKLAEVKLWYQVCFGEIEKNSNLDRDFLKTALELLPQVITGDTWGLWTKEISNRTGKKGKELFLPLRLALTALSEGPAMNHLLPILSYTVIQKRLAY